MKSITALLLVLLPLATSAWAQTAAPAQRPAPNWGAPAVSPPTAAPGVPGPRPMPDASAPLPKALQRAELAIVALCWPSIASDRGCGPVAGEGAGLARGLSPIPIAAGFRLELGGAPATATPAPPGARANAIAIDPKSCQKSVPMFLKVANVGNATFDGKASGGPAMVGYAISQGGQVRSDKAVEIKQSLNPGASVTLYVGGLALPVGDYELRLQVYQRDDGGVLRKVENAGTLRVRC
ncbi:MAG: hypothetical protein NZM07_07040 [Elioraea sp.]|nr:hypothetical protein [Elioraea sp.]